jgi:hypothetical protein
VKSGGPQRLCPFVFTMHKSADRQSALTKQFHNGGYENRTLSPRIHLLGILPQRDR